MGGQYHRRHAPQYFCQFCGQGFTRNENRIYHEYKHNGKKPIGCGLCNYKCRSPQALHYHAKTQHGGDMQKRGLTWQTRGDVTQSDAVMTNEAVLRAKELLPIKEDGKWRCPLPLCVQKTRGRRDMKNHINWHFNIKPYACNQCDRTYNSTQALRTHTRRSHPETFQCVTCGKACGSRRGLVDHFLRHHDNQNVNESTNENKD